MVGLLAKLKVEVNWGATGFAPTTGFTDESQRTRAVTIRRGRDTELFECQPGSAHLSLTNTDGRFNVQSTQLANVIRPMSTVRITATPGDDTATGYSPLWYGFIDEIKPTWRRDKGTADIDAVDAMALFGLARASSTNTTDFGSIIAVALQGAGFPGGTSLQSPWRDLSSGALGAVVTTYSSAIVSDMIRNVIQSDNKGAMFFMSRSGKATYQDSTRRNGQSTASPIWDLNASDIYDYQETISAREVANAIRVTDNAGVVQTANDTASWDIYGVRERRCSARRSPCAIIRQRSSERSSKRSSAIRCASPFPRRAARPTRAFIWRGWTCQSRTRARLLKRGGPCPNVR